MPRKIRVEYPGAIYHVMRRGDRREDLFHDDVDRQEFLKTLAEACQKTGFQAHACCLMRNCFERRMEARRAQESDGAEWAPIGQGWCLGGEGFKQEMLGRMEGRLGEHHAGELRRETAEAKAERIIGEEFKRL